MRNDSNVNWISLSCVATGRVFTVTHSVRFPGKWSWITECVVREFECDADDLDCSEDDGREFVTLKGEPLAEIHNCYLRGNVAGLVRVTDAPKLVVVGDHAPELSNVESV